MMRRPSSSRLLAAFRGRRSLSSSRTIQEHDVLLLRQHGTRYPKWHLTAPVRPDAVVRLSYGAHVSAADLIGRNILDVVHDSRGHSVVLHEPSLASYIVNQLGERVATPIYPHDANTIVSLLDLHPSRPGEDDGDQGETPPLEIFEAGTGMGSLTLHLARAIHAANPPVPSSLRIALCRAGIVSDRFARHARPDLSPEHRAALDAYHAQRRVVLHTLDNKIKTLNGAFRLVRDFRRALYLPSIDFHAGAIEDYLTERLAQSAGQPFLSRAVLDLPSAHDNAERLIEALLPNALLVIFQPSISQIVEFEAWNRQTKQPLRLEKVLELPVTTTTDGLHDSAGGRQWDVRMTFPKAKLGASDQMVQVLRPKVGDRIGGGGFVAIFRRWPAGEAPESPTADEVEREGLSSEVER